MAALVCRLWQDSGLPCDYRPGTPSGHPELGTAFHPTCLEAELGLVVLVHQEVAGGGSVCGLPADGVRTPPLRSFPAFRRVPCRGCLAPQRALPASQVAVHRADVAELLAVLAPVASRLTTLDPAILVRLGDALERVA